MLTKLVSFAINLSQVFIQFNFAGSGSPKTNSIVTIYHNVSQILHTIQI